MSAVKPEREAAAALYEKLGLGQPTTKAHPDINKEELIESVRNALYASKICSYAQARPHASCPVFVSLRPCLTAVITCNTLTLLPCLVLICSMPANFACFAFVAAVQPFTG
jgi:6-phosphogluconate dehydrogenase, C-terminal domain